MKMKKYFASAALMLSLLSCDGSTAANNTEVTLFTLPGKLKDIDYSYIPYGYVDQGSHDRATYLGMELAVRNIPSAAITAENCDIPNADTPGTILLPNGKNHVVYTSIVVREDGKNLIADPLMSDQFFTEEEWRNTLNANEDVNIFYEPIAYPYSMDGNGKCDQHLGDENIPEKVADMTPFLLDNIMIHCAYLKNFLAKLPDYSQAKEDKLVNRTYELITELRKLNLIEESADQETIDNLAKGAWCPPAIPDK